MTWLQRELGITLRIHLASIGWSQADLARAAGMSQKHLSQMLLGRSDGTVSMWSRLYEASDCPLRDREPDAPTDEQVRDTAHALLTDTLAPDALPALLGDPPDEMTYLRLGREICRQTTNTTI